ncbi:unnamed protein product [Bursaphelenchus xylophilus]|uniref:(pine wood nematode) hypothetical protein n=1 Tax=Bursaphelenchus xylophilus TaxID=6326 RepID=A0A1I7SRF5_BURXY|nr:unnamed protein product [Bursaphelenchus xylophilus]CAG9102497.1 unnamed protein product [Bursaphelenchus xylophilus]
MELLRNVELTTKSGKLVDADVLHGKIVAFYFGAHWCEPCRRFTPILRDFYVKAALQGVEIVWFSRDETMESMEEYFKEHGNWLRAPFQQPGCKCCCLTFVKEQQGFNYLKKYHIDSLPTLIVVKPDGTAVNKNGVDDVYNKDPDDVVAEWKRQVYQ